MNKRATTDSFALSPWLFMVLGMIGLLIVIGVVLFYGKLIDVRHEEAKTLADKIIEGISVNGKLNEKVLSNDFDIFQETSLNKDFIYNGGDFYFNLEIKDDDKQVKMIEEGNKDFKIQCEINGERLAECFRKDVIMITPSNKKYTVKILCGSNQEGSKI